MEDTDSTDSHIPCGQQIEPEEDSHRTTEDENHEQSRQQDRQIEPDHWLNGGSFVDGSEDSNSNNSNRQHREGHWFGSTDGDRSYWTFKYSETRVVHREWYSCYCRSSSNDSSTSTSNSTCGNNSNATIERTNMHGELDRGRMLLPDHGPTNARQAEDLDHATRERNCGSSRQERALQCPYPRR
ncbi:uncharacterized protein LOC121601075 [Anopheles merus]|uniref:uncharacterized protein LOC121601075 n=1 Tax=Anopheles merus TaxID=30066 RepID=UPI001BE425E2|nr:uncharacterized protein LOC121601075 [Anopheles merus]